VALGFELGILHLLNVLNLLVLRVNKIHKLYLKSKARHRWLMPVILATQEAEIRRIVI
jgi:hypothetical protein